MTLSTVLKLSQLLTNCDIFWRSSCITLSSQVALLSRCSSGCSGVERLLLDRLTLNSLSAHLRVWIGLWYFVFLAPHQKNNSTKLYHNLNRLAVGIKHIKWVCGSARLKRISFVQRQVLAMSSTLHSFVQKRSISVANIFDTDTNTDVIYGYPL